MTRTRYVAPPASAYLRYYQHQQGAGLPYFRGAVYGQRGAGFGSIFSKILGGIKGLISRTPQWVKDAGKMVAQQAVRTGGELIGEGSRSENSEDFKRRAKRKLKEAGGQLLSNVGSKLQQQQGSGIKRRRIMPVRRRFTRLKNKRQQFGKGIKRTRGSGKKTKRKRKPKRTKQDFFGI